MSGSQSHVELTGNMSYAAALATIAKIWPHLPVYFYRPTIEHYKEGLPSGEDLELRPDEPLNSLATSPVILRGDMTVQKFHAAIMVGFSLETELRGLAIHAIWMTTLDEADSGVRRGHRE
ncbi:MAG: hypothetical protein JWN70_4569 [Planctomycetaceae bacterium]|nr:hypothetical protein [Planctomycetaceae bacterium]